MAFHFKIHQQSTYSRSHLLLRTFFGWFYIALPHLFLLFFASIWGAILLFLSFWTILFTGKYPRSWFEYQVKLKRWELRLNAVILNLSDDYPPFGLDAEYPPVEFNIDHPEHVSRSSVLLRALFGALYVGIPHGFLLMFRIFFVQILMFLAWWAVLFTGEYPKSWFEWAEGTLRWDARVNCYLMFLTQDYPPFTGEIVEGENA